MLRLNVALRWSVQLPVKTWRPRWRCQPGRRRTRVAVAIQGPDREPQGVEIPAEGGTDTRIGQRHLHLHRLGVVEGPEQVADELLSHRCPFHSHHASGMGPRPLRRHDSFSFKTAACSRLFTVPTGMPSTSAASRYFMPLW